MEAWTAPNSSAPESCRTTATGSCSRASSRHLRSRRFPSCPSIFTTSFRLQKRQLCLLPLFTHSRRNGQQELYFYFAPLRNDNHYYSYTELQLSCGVKNRYNKVQAAYLTDPGKELAQAMSESGEYGNVREWDKVLFVVASSEEGATESALCMYPLKNINQKLLAIVTACYTNNGKIDDRLVVESPYTSSKDDPCVKHDVSSSFS